MPRRYYTPQQRQHALDALSANLGDVNLTAAQLGIPARTIYFWQLRAIKNSQSQSPQSPSTDIYRIPPASPRPEGEGLGVRVGEVSTSLRDLQTQMLADAHVLAQSIQSAIADAPLGQRVAALAQLIDRIIKLAAQLPGESSEPDELIVRVARHVEKEDDDEEDNGLESAGRTPDPEENDEM